MIYLGYCVAAWLLLIGLYGIVTSRHLVHLCLCLTVVQASTYVLLVTIGYRLDGKAPIYADISQSEQTVDPVVQALMLTDVVVEATVVALLLAIAVQVHKRTGVVDPDHVDILKG
jgi:multicomponent Na+:H+ antiporter subunit C